MWKLLIIFIKENSNFIQTYILFGFKCDQFWTWDGPMRAQNAAEGAAETLFPCFAGHLLVESEAALSIGCLMSWRSGEQKQTKKSSRWVLSMDWCEWSEKWWRKGF